MICSAFRFVSKPICPVAQNVHPIAHPICVEIHTVDLGSPPTYSDLYCMRTVSTDLSLVRLSNTFVVSPSSLVIL